MDMKCECIILQFNISYPPPRNVQNYFKIMYLCLKVKNVIVNSTIFKLIMKVIIFIKDILAISWISGLAKTFDTLLYKVQKKLKLIVNIYRAYYIYFPLSIIRNLEPPLLTDYFNLFCWIIICKPSIVNYERIM